MTTTEPSPAAPTTPAAASPVTLIGLGAMGATLGNALLSAGHPTTVWNRTRSRAAPLVDAGAMLAPDVGTAITSSPVTLMCVRDADAAAELLNGSPATALQDRVLVNLTSSTPRQAREMARSATEHGARYLDGAIMVPTPMIGHSEAMFVFSGADGIPDEARGPLSALAGQLAWLGTDPGLAAVYDLAMLDLYLTGMAGFLHAAAMVEAEGVDVADFLPYAAGITDVLRDTLPDLARDVAARSYPGDEDTTEMELAIAGHVVEASEAGGIDTAFPSVVRTLLQRAVDTGHGLDGFSSIVEQFRAPTE